MMQPFISHRPTLQGNKVFLMPIRQADVPNQCSSSNEICLQSFMVLLHLHCPSGASLRYAVCHTSCSSYGIRHGSYCVLHATSFITSFVPLHYTSFVACPFAARQGILANPHNRHESMHLPFRNPSLQYSPGFITLHYVIHSLQQRSVHPLPIIWRALRPATAAGLSWFLSPQPPALIKQKHTPNPCVSLLLSIAVSRLFSQHRGRRTQPIPFVPLSIGLWRHAPGLQCGQVCHTAMLLFGSRLYYLLLMHNPDTKKK